MTPTTSTRTWNGAEELPSSDPQTEKCKSPSDGRKSALRNLVEHCINRLKNARRIATKYDKTITNYLGFVQIVAIPPMDQTLSRDLIMMV